MKDVHPSLKFLDPKIIFIVHTLRTPIVDHSLLQDPPLKIRIEDPSKSNQGK